MGLEAMVGIGLGNAMGQEEGGKGELDSLGVVDG